MQVGGTGHGAEASIKAAEAMNGIIQNAVDKTQETSKKMLGVIVEQKVNHGAGHSGQVDYKA